MSQIMSDFLLQLSRFSVSTYLIAYIILVSIILVLRSVIVRD